MKQSIWLPLLLAMVAMPAVLAQEIAPPDGDALRRWPDHHPHPEVVARTAAMVRDPAVQALARRHGLRVLDVTWEDTARSKLSAYGPNISDMTLQVPVHGWRGARSRLYCMPVIRTPNFADRSADIPLDRLWVLVGNERGGSLSRVNLRELLGNPRAYLHDSSSWGGRRKSLLAPRDSHALVSAQACFLPVPRQGRANFNPAIFNYQSVSGDPAVLTIVATREGTSITIVDNTRDAFQAGRARGQRLFFNQCGERASFTATRLSDDRRGREVIRPPERRSNLNLMFVVQVPLLQMRPRPWRVLDELAEADGAPAGGAPAESKAMRRSDVEDAVLGHGRIEGPFTEIDGLAIERDPRYPIRVTVQFYKATSNGVVGARDMAAIAGQIERVYREADFVGSLVTEGWTGRPTEPGPIAGPPPIPFPAPAPPVSPPLQPAPATDPPAWWDEFWLRYERSTLISREQALILLRKARGSAWMPTTEKELARALGFEG